MRQFENIGELIRKNRIRVNTESGTALTQSKLSKILGYKNGQFISNVERGLCSIPEEKVYQLSKLINVEISEIVEAMTADFVSNTIRQVLKYKDDEVENEAENKNLDVDSQGRSPVHLPVF